MPAKEKPIKVIKRKQREVLAAQGEELPVPQVKTESETKREILETITLWIEEQREAQKVLTRNFLNSGSLEADDVSS
jgi:hypothetical protein